MAEIVQFSAYVGVLLLLGVSLFPFYSATSRDEQRKFAAAVRPLLFVAALLILASGIGSAWALRLALGAALLLLLIGRMQAWRSIATLFVALVLLADIVWSGHAGHDSSATARPHLVSDVFHTIAAGAWFGALCCFATFSLRSTKHANRDEIRRYHDALARFSGVGPVVIATLILSGILLIGLQKISGESAAAYNRVLVAKLVMFGAMLGLAAANRFWLTPRLSAALDAGEELGDATRALRISLLAETGLGILVLAAATWLGTFPAP